MKYFIVLLMSSFAIIFTSVWWADSFSSIGLIRVGTWNCYKSYGDACIPEPFWLSASLFSIVFGVFAALALYGMYRGRNGENKKGDKYFFAGLFLLVFIAIVTIYIFSPIAGYPLTFAQKWIVVLLLASSVFTILKRIKVKWQNLWLRANVLAMSLLHAIFLLQSLSIMDRIENVVLFAAIWFLFVSINMLLYESFLYGKRLSPNLHRRTTVFIALFFLVFASLQIYKTHADYNKYLVGLPKLAVEGNALAQYRMFPFYMNGTNGFQRNYEEAYFLQKIARNNGFSFNGLEFPDRLGPTHGLDELRRYSIEKYLTPEQRAKVEARAAAWKLAHLGQ